jgi:SecD/SecF fusion protein
VLLAQEASSFTSSMLAILYFLGIMVAVIALPIVLGTMLARWLRMRGYEWKLSLIFVTVAIGLMICLRAFDWQKQRFRMPMGVDLKGGVVLIYEIDLGAREKTDTTKPEIDRADLVQALGHRINPSGTKEIVVRPYGDRQVEIVIPEVDAEEVQNIKRQISTAGMLEFRIVANTRDHQDIIALAQEQAQDSDPARRISKNVMQKAVGDDGVTRDERVGYWAQAAKAKIRAVELQGLTLRDSASGEIIDPRSLGQPHDDKELLNDFLKANGLDNIDILVATNDGADVTGDYLGMVSPSVDEYLTPCVNFRMRGEGITKFQYLTSSNLPDTDSSPPFYRHLAIILDEQLISFPRLITTISDSGRITGGFTQPEVDFLVGILRAGKLPATLKKEPISENHIGSMLGDDTIQKGKTATLVSLLAVFAFMAFYYRFSGLVACAALAINLLFVFAAMILLNAPLTLPGVAGLALTVGMAVDSNVLIFERLREELARGTGLRMAIRNGFDRATTTIVDSNLTTVITALVLYAVGTDQLRGFAVTLTLGLMVSMFTAVFCSRVAFDIAERRGWIKGLRMMRLIGTTNLDFIGKCGIAVTCSSLLILVGFITMFMRGQSIFDIDFTGGVSVTMVLRDSLPPDEVRARLNDHFADAKPPVSCTVNTVGVADRPADSVYKIDANLKAASDLEEAIEKTFRDPSGNTLLLTYTMDFADVKKLATEPARTAAPAGGAPTPPAEKRPAETPPADAAKPAPAEQPAAEQPAAAPAAPAPAEAKPAPDAAPAGTPPAGNPGVSMRRADLPPDSLVAWAGRLMPDSQDESAPPKEPQQQPSAAEPAAPEKTPTDAAPAPADAGAAQKPPADATPAPTQATAPQEPPATTSPPAPAEPEDVTSVARVTFGDEINAPVLREKIKEAYFAARPGANTQTERPATAASQEEVPGLFVDPTEYFTWDQSSAAASKEWYVRMTATPEQTTAVLERMKKDMTSTPVFPSSSTVGGQVAGDTRSLAIMALFASWLGIIIYVWVRFQNLIFGLAAVIALIHDVLVTVTAIAVSAYLTGIFGFLLIDDFKINLTIVAALLTIIGYSINDTIVIFDRVREIRGKSPRITGEMINTSINQTLSRTLLTAWTVLLVTLILYVFGGAGIHGFAFAMTIGTITGAYSTVYIAAPIVLWMLRAEKKKAATD